MTDIEKKYHITTWLGINIIIKSLATGKVEQKDINAWNAAFTSMIGNNNEEDLSSN